MNPPVRIRRGEVITADWLNWLRDYAVINCVEQSDDITPVTSTHGTALRLKRKPKPDTGTGFPSSATPFVIFQHAANPSVPTTDRRNFRVHRGLVNSTHADNDAEETTPLNILVAENATAHKVWCKVEFTRLAPCVGGDDGTTIDSMTFQHHATAWWTGHPAQF